MSMCLKLFQGKANYSKLFWQADRRSCRRRPPAVIDRNIIVT